MGREIRLHRIEIRVSGEELSLINSKRGTMRLRPFIRHSVLSGIPPLIPKINQDALRELRGLTANLNQLSKHANQIGELTELDSLKKTCSELRAVLAGATE
jgi:hypothetical protein